VASDAGTRWVADYRDLLDCVDAAVVAVPTALHHQIAGDFLRAGIDVLVEKPLARNAREARELLTLAHERGCILQVGHVERFNPAFVAARPLLHSARYIRAERFSPFSFRSTDIGVVLDVMIHDLDLLLAIVDEPVQSVEALGISILGEHEDAVQARVRFRGGCIADLAANRVSPVSKRSMQVWSRTGCVQLDFAARQLAVYSATAALRFGTPPIARALRPGADLEALKASVFGTFIATEQPAILPCDPLTEELLAFARSIVTREAPLVAGEQALAAIELSEQILCAVARHQADNQSDPDASQAAA
jgi:predicted dehydrogenase